MPALPQQLLSRGVYEMPYTLGGKVVLVAVTNAGERIAEELVDLATTYPAAVWRLRTLLDDKDPSMHLHLL